MDTTSLFNEAQARRPTREASVASRATTVGLQCSENSVNTPAKAWRQIFTESLIHNIVKYTNDYGSNKCKDWVNISKPDLMDFISCLFVAGIQKRKDAPANWFSNSPVRESPIMKQITSGKKFHTILRYLHVCDLESQPAPSDENYTPIYKVQEMMEYLEERYSKLYSPGEDLSLDESLIRCFGRIQFKVRIVTKAARYGMKLYVITDAMTAFVLKVIVYTGKYTYHQSDSVSEKKTVQVVKQLCKEYAGSHRTIYIDRFYTSIDLLKALDEMDLYVTGTMMKNRIPKDLVITKSLKEFKQMSRGDFKRHTYNYTMNDGRQKTYGLVCWKDRDIVYCLTNRTNTNEEGCCYQRSAAGIVCIQRPKVIEYYNTYMGGVDIADMRRLHCNSTIMGQNRWWLKLFFIY